MPATGGPGHGRYQVQEGVAMTAVQRRTPSGQRYVRFPPHQRNVLLPARPARAMAQAMSLYTACKPLPLFAQRVLWFAARVGGRLLPARWSDEWAPAMPADEFAELREDWSQKLGWAPRAMAGYERIQPGRAGLTVLLIGSKGSVVVRVRRKLASLALEQSISAAAARLGPSAFRVPRLIAQGSAGGWAWSAYETIARRPHRPVLTLPSGATGQIRELVEAVVPRPPGAPATWRGAHCDLTPWNFRRSSTGVWLIDWEDADWAPLGVDELYFAATVRSLRPGTVRPLRLSEQYREAADYLSELVANRRTASSEEGLKRRLLAALSPADSADHGLRYRE